MTTPPTIRLAKQTDLQMIAALQRLESNRVGFIPYDGLVQHVASGKVHVAETRDSRIVAYLYGGHASREQPWVRPILQLVVHPDFRRQRLATLLVLRRATDASAAGQHCLQAWTRIDLPANRLWSALGFIAVGERAPRTARKKPAVLWRLPLTAVGQQRMRELPVNGGYRASKQEPQALLPWPEDRVLDSQGQWWNVNGGFPEPLDLPREPLIV